MATKSKKAKHGEKMIEIRLRFWTNGIAEEKGNIIPKQAWTSGVVSIDRNESHGIQPTNPLPFHSLLDIGRVVEKVLITHDIILHPGNRDEKYLQPL